MTFLDLIYFQLNFFKRPVREDLKELKRKTMMDLQQRQISGINVTAGLEGRRPSDAESDAGIIDREQLPAETEVAKSEPQTTL